ncbi:hypothetical protein V6N13_061905 [Hibiscus sabdariffa]
MNVIDPSHGTKDLAWKLFWSKLAPPNVELFVWKVAHGRIATKVELLKRNINLHNSVICPLCSIDVESISHLLCYCHISWSVWQRWCNVWHVSFVFPASICEFFIQWVCFPAVSIDSKNSNGFNWSFSAVPRECNSLADSLAKKGISRLENYIEVAPD